MYIVIETFGGADCAVIVIDEKTLNNKVFDTEAEAIEEAKECQSGVVVEIKNQ